MRKLVPILIGVLLHLPTASASDDNGASILAVNFKPEVLMAQSGGVVHLKIRLSEDATAQIWLADNCSAQQVEGAPGYEVENSGEFEIPLESVPGSGSRVCLQSTDKLSAETSAVQPAPAEEKPQAQ